MKRNIYLILALLFMGAVQVRAQGESFVITVKENSGAFNELWSSSPISTCKLTFSDGQMMFYENGVLKSTFNIKDIDGMGFYNSQSVEPAVAMDLIDYLPVTEELVVNSQPGTLVAIYGVDGRKVGSKLLTIATDVVSVEHLPEGVYVAVAGGQTLKFVK